MQRILNGWAVLPLVPGGKEPFTPLLPKVKGKGTWKALSKRPATKEAVRDWFDRYPDINIGIITGQPSGLVVIDFDTVKPEGLPVTAMERQSADVLNVCFADGSKT